MTDVNKNQTYSAARERSERMKQEAYAAANQLVVDAIDAAGARFRRYPTYTVATYEAAHSAASDARAGMYREAEQFHANRLAALARHFGLTYRGLGDPDAGHAVAYIAEIDPAGLWAPLPEPAPEGKITIVNLSGIQRQVRVDSHGRVIQESPIADAYQPRGTFTGGPEAFLAAKAAGVAITKPVEADTPVVVPETPAAPVTEPPPPGLLAAIKAALARKT